MDAAESLLKIFSTAFGVALTGAMAPGPVLTLTVSESARRGFIAGPLIMAGHAVLELLLVIGLLFGIGNVLTQPTAKMVIAVVGGLFLIYLGYGLIKDSVTKKLSLSDSLAVGNRETGPSGGKWTDSAIYPVAAGLLTSLSNPYWVIWWATVGLGLMTGAMRFGKVGVSAFYTGHILADFAWYCLIAAVITGGRRFINDTVYRGVMIACGAFLVILGIGFLVNRGL
ncbi:MAG: LysE family transporter [Solirubrobacterales bacterium]